jgi:hypothetical protein
MGRGFTCRRDFRGDIHHSTYNKLSYQGRVLDAIYN